MVAQKKSRNRKAIPPGVKTEFLLTKDGKELFGWKFIGTNRAGRELLAKLTDGEIAGLKYDTDVTIRPHSEGCGEYWIGFPLP